MLAEIREGRQKFGYEMEGRVVRFDAAVSAEHRKMAKSLARYLLEAKWLNIITAPMIWFCVLPILFMDVVAEVYQFVCFPIYGIPKVRRRDYVVMDRGRLLYLNSMERFNCVYCGYVNGVLAYVQEIAGRTEQHWCPIKHAVSLKTRHKPLPAFPGLRRRRTILQTPRGSAKGFRGLEKGLYERCASTQLANK
jgi:hypothetical protein